jgi:hypothetical protein
MLGMVVFASSEGGNALIISVRIIFLSDSGGVLCAQEEGVAFQM